MKKLTLFYLLSIVSLFIISSCSDDENEKTPETKITITEFILNEGCSWKVQKDGNLVDMIRSQAEMNSRIEKKVGAVVNYPDFTKNSILLASGSTSYGVYKVETKLTKETNTQYTLNVDVYTNMAAVAQGYFVEVLTPILDSNVTVNKKTTIH